MSKNSHRKKNEKTQQCLTCSSYFVNLSQHKRCARATNYEELSRERKYATESDFEAMSRNSADAGRLSRASSALSLSPMRSTRSQSRISRSMQGDSSQFEVNDSINFSDAAKSSQNFATDSETTGRNSRQETNSFHAH